MPAFQMLQSRRHVAPVAARAYVIPVVRELPRPIEATHDGMW
jgi:hypothetical protein